MALCDAQLLSYPIKVVWAGWETTTTALQRSGWKLAAAEEHRAARPQLTLAGQLKSPKNEGTLHLYGRVEFRSFFDPRDVGRLRDMVIPVQVAGDFISQTFVPSREPLRLIDAEPTWAHLTTWRLSEQHVFLAADESVGEQIIVEPDTVMSLLEKIHKLHEPELADIRRRNAAGQGRRMHAQIVSLAA